MLCQYVLRHLPNSYKIFNRLQLYFVLDILAREWRKLRTEGLNDMYWSNKIVQVIKSRRMRRAILVARMV